MSLRDLAKQSPRNWEIATSSSTPRDYIMTQLVRGNDMEGNNVLFNSRFNNVLPFDESVSEHLKIRIRLTMVWVLYEPMLPDEYEGLPIIILMFVSIMPILTPFSIPVSIVSSGNQSSF